MSSLRMIKLIALQKLGYFKQPNLCHCTRQAGTETSTRQASTKMNERSNLI